MVIRNNPEDRLAVKSKTDNKPMGIAITLVLVIAAGLGFWSYQQHQNKMDIKKQVAEIDRRLEEQSKLDKQAQAKRAEEISKSIKKSQAINTALVIEEPQEKQTVFNDQNYKPKKPANTYKTAQTTQTNSRPQARAKKPDLVTRKKVNWSWSSQSGAGKKTNRGTFTFEDRNNFINTSQVCSNHGYGSIIYRDCRKAAKKYFNDQCKGGYHAACAAAGMTP